jgi:hypothetical protein
MSYCRFTEADAYIYDDSYYGLMCCMCSLQPTRETLKGIFANGPYRVNDNFVAGYDYNKMITHIAEHRAADHYIPLDVDRQLIEDRNNATDK